MYATVYATYVYAIVYATVYVTSVYATVYATERRVATRGEICAVNNATTGGGSISRHRRKAPAICSARSTDTAYYSGPVWFSPIDVITAPMTSARAVNRLAGDWPHTHSHTYTRAGRAVIG